jgi:hypothetical protein
MLELCLWNSWPTSHQVGCQKLKIHPAMQLLVDYETWELMIFCY